MRLNIYTLLILLLPMSLLHAQKQNTIKTDGGFIDHFKIGAGLSVFSIQAGDKNLNTMSLMPNVDEEGKLVIGGQMGGGQPGYHVQLSAYLDKEEDYKIPFGISHNFMGAAQTRPASSQGVLTRYHHDLDLIKLNIGFHASILDIDSSEAKIYIGPEIMYSFVTSSKYTEEFDFLSPDEKDIEVANLSKADAARWGGLVRLGVEGHLHKNIFVNIGLGLGVLNLFGRDDERGELFTFTNRLEISESYVYFLDFSLILQYQF